MASRPAAGGRANERSIGGGARARRAWLAACVVSEIGRQTSATCLGYAVEAIRHLAEGGRYLASGSVSPSPVSSSGCLCVPCLSPACPPFYPPFCPALPGPALLPPLLIRRLPEMRKGLLTMRPEHLAAIPDSVTQWGSGVDMMLMQLFAADRAKQVGTAGGGRGELRLHCCGHVCVGWASPRLHELAANQVCCGSRNSQASLSPYNPRRRA